MRPGPLLRLARCLSLTLLLIAGGQTLPAMGQQEPASPIFPLKIDASDKFLTDASGKPVLVTGEAAWSLIADLNQQDAALYLNDRRQRGFNAILVNLIESKFSRNPPANAQGDKPFIGRAFERINPAYFDHAASIIKAAQDAGMVVFLTPAYLGVSGSDQGWYAPARQAGADALAAYGRAIAQRFAAFPNIIWVMGGDFDPPEQETLSSLAKGIKSVLPAALMTMHGGRNANPLDVWQGADWLNINTVYDYDNVHQSVLAQTRPPQAMPVLLIETLYENERGTSAQTIRMNAYSSLLAGAAGQFFGNSPVWHFGGPGVFSAEGDWHQALNSPGAQSIEHLRKLFEQIAWPQLQPDRAQSLTATPDLFAASLADRSLTVVYGASDSGEGFVVRQQALTSGQAALWFDPSSGQFSRAQGVAINGDFTSFVPPANKNAAGDTDWLLLFGSEQQLPPIQKP